MRKILIMLFLFYSLTLIFLTSVSHAIYYLNNCTIISSSGTYLLNNSIFHINQSCIDIRSSDVILNCQHNYIQSGGNGSGVIINSFNFGPFHNISIFNCFLSDFQYGIEIDGGENITIMNNTVFNITDFGIYHHDNPSYTWIINNTISGNGAGIMLYDGTAGNITIRDNYIYSNEYYGIEFFSLGWENIKIYNNYINASTPIGGYLPQKVAEFNTSLQYGPNIINRPFICGNAYFTPSGSGYSEICNDTDHDGICDQPYSITSDNIDYCPLALSRTYPLNPKIYVGNNLVWQYYGLFNTSQKTNIYTVILREIRNMCKNTYPCYLPIRIETESRGGLSFILTLKYMIYGYKVYIRNPTSNSIHIDNISLSDYYFSSYCKSHFNKPHLLLPGSVTLIRMTCSLLPCSEKKRITIYTDCGIINDYYEGCDD